MFDSSAFGPHEKTVHVHDEESGLSCIIAIHSTALGPAAGGCRLWSYATSADALTDALRLSKGMSYKNAMAGLPMGGGKAVILGPIANAKRHNVFKAFGAAVESLQGEYITAEDVGVSVEDMITISGQTGYVSGIGGSGFDVGGDPSPYTALGVRRAIEAAVFAREQRPDIEGLRIAVQGLGNVGANLCRELADHGALLTVADINTELVSSVCDTYGADQVSPETILLQDVDIVAPCALGGTITEDIVAGMSAQYIVGAANNQLASGDAGRMLFDRNITYAPDYVANAGGIIAVAAEYFRNGTSVGVKKQINEIYNRVLEILTIADKRKIAPHIVADEIAEQKILQASRPSSRRALSP